MVAVGVGDNRPAVASVHVHTAAAAVARIVFRGEDRLQVAVHAFDRAVKNTQAFRRDQGTGTYLVAGVGTARMAMGAHIHTATTYRIHWGST